MSHFLFDKQLSVVLENLPGTLAEVMTTSAQASAGRARVDVRPRGRRLRAGRAGGGGLP